MTPPSPDFLNDPDGIAHFLARLRARFDDACTLRDDYASLWQDCYTYTLPENALFTGALSSPGRARAALFDGTAPDAVDQLAASLLAYLTPPWTNWFAFETGPQMDDHARATIAPYLTHATGILQSQIDRSTLYTDLHQCFLDLVVGGTACLAIYQNDIGAPVRFKTEAVPLHDVILGADARGDLTTVYRHRTVTAAECTALRQLSPDLCAASLNVPDESQQDRSTTDPQTYSDFSLDSQGSDIDIIEFSIPYSDTYLIGAFCATPKDDHDLIYLLVRDHSPYLTFRWQKTPGLPFGRSPVMKVLPDIKCANTVVELILKNASIAATGIWQAEDDGVLNIQNIQFNPGSIITKATGSSGLTPLEMPARFDVSQLVLDDLRARIRHALLVDRFAALDTPRMTATEVRERQNEANHILGAIYGRLHTELLLPLLTRLYDILRKTGEVQDIPLDGRTVMITSLSPLSRIHAIAGVQSTLAFIDAVGSMGGSAMTFIHSENTVRYLSEIMGVPEHLIQPQPVTTTPADLI